MATKYTFSFTDTTKTEFDVQSYTSNGIDVPSSTVLLARASQANTTLKLYGKGLSDYGEGVLQNQVYMLENYANGNKPEFSIEGQIWYNNTPSASELFIRNSTGNGDDLVNDWTPVILASGTSAMTGELTLKYALSDAIANDLVAVPKYYVDEHAADFNLHLTPDQNDFFDGLDVSGSPALTASDVNQLIGITGNVQTQLDNKLSLDGGTMSGLSPAANITFSGGEVLGLPALPSGDGASASKKYVDDQILSGAGGDGALTSVQWIAATGSPPIVVANTTARFVVTFPDTSTAFVETNGISREGHGHDAVDIAVDNSFDVSYPTNVQGDIELLASKVSTLETAAPDVATVDITRTFELLTSTLTTGTIHPALAHAADDNKLSITVNGVKQYNHTKAVQNIEYADTAMTVGDIIPTGLDESLNYDFYINVDGGSPATLITISAGTPISTHGELSIAISDALNGSPLIGATFEVDGANNVEIFRTYSSGSGSSVSITDPSTADTYLFEVDASPDTIVAATFLSESSAVTGSPPGSPAPNPDTIEISGDVTASFPVGQPFAIRNSVVANYGSYDGIYSVHVNGATFGGAETTIPIAKVDDPTINTALLPGYDPNAGSPNPVPVPSPFGSVYITPIVGIEQVATGVDGIEGDYTETDVSGNDILVGNTTEYVVFNYDILSGSKIEILHYS